MHTLLNPKRRSSAFSLIEVVIAVGIFAISIVAVIGLLGPTNKSVADVRDTDDATRVINAIQSKLQTIAQTSKYPLTTSTQSGFVYIGSTYLQLASQVQSDDANTSFDPSTKTYILFASRDGSRIGAYNDQNVWNGETPANSLKYFEVELIRNDAAPAVLSPVTNDATAGFLAYTIRLRWPAYTPDGQRFTDNTQKSVLLVPAAVHR